MVPFSAMRFISLTAASGWVGSIHEHVTMRPSDAFDISCRPSLSAWRAPVPSRPFASAAFRMFGTFELKVTTSASMPNRSISDTWFSTSSKAVLVHRNDGPSSMVFVSSSHAT